MIPILIREITLPALTKIILSAALVILSGCTKEYLYNAGLSHQRGQCELIPSRGEREACLSRSGSEYDNYRREREANRK